MATGPVKARRRDWVYYAPLDASPFHQARAAAGDFAEGLARHRAWRYLAAEHVKNSYRRTVLGPWWLTAQSALYVFGLAAVFGQLQHAPLKNFLPYVAVGYLTFALLAGLTRGGAVVFTSQSGVIKSTRQPLTSLALRTVTIELIQFAHNFIIVLGLFAFGLIQLSPWLALAPFGLALILINGAAVSLWLGMMVARFRDVGPLVDSVLQVIVFFTPVFYRASSLHGAQSLLIRWNPFTYLIDFFRSAVLGQRPALYATAGSVAFTLIDVVVAAVVFSRMRSRLPYWVS